MRESTDRHEIILDASSSCLPPSPSLQQYPICSPGLHETTYASANIIHDTVTSSETTQGRRCFASPAPLRPVGASIMASASSSSSTITTKLDSADTKALVEALQTRLVEKGEWNRLLKQLRTGLEDSGWESGLNEYARGEAAFFDPSELASGAFAIPCSLYPNINVSPRTSDFKAG